MSGGAPVSARSMKRTKAGVLVRDITLADIEACFTLPTEKACVKLGVGLTILKRLCRKHGIQRWPYRSLLKAGKAQRHPPAASPRAGGHPKQRTTPSPATRTKPFQQTSTASSHTSHGCELSADGFGSGTMEAAAATAQQQWAPFAVAPMPAAAMAAPPPSPPPVPLVSKLTAAADAAGSCPPAFLAAMQPVAAPSPRKRKQPAGGFEEQQPQPEGAMAKHDSQLNLLLSAIDACERGTPAAAPPPDTPFEFRENFFSPVSPLACLPPASVFERRPFSHSQRSAFQPLEPSAASPAAQQQPAATAGATQLQSVKSLLALKMALLQRRQAAGGGLARSTSGTSVAALLEALSNSAAATPPTPGTPASPASFEQKRLQLAQKLLLVRAALQARIARKRAALGLDAAAAVDLPSPQVMPPPPPVGSFASFQLPPRPPQPKAADQGFAAFQLQSRSGSGPIPISALPPTDLLEGLSAQESLALQSARSLLAQY